MAHWHVPLPLQHHLASPRRIFVRLHRTQHIHQQYHFAFSIQPSYQKKSKLLKSKNRFVTFNWYKFDIKLALMSKINWCDSNWIRFFLLDSTKNKRAHSVCGLFSFNPSIFSVFKLIFTCNRTPQLHQTKKKEIVRIAKMALWQTGGA